jgi:hypothetical protein
VYVWESSHYLISYLGHLFLIGDFKSSRFNVDINASKVPNHDLLMLNLMNSNPKGFEKGPSLK